ncbi:MAG: phosphomethylpyrimidine synthase ThiC, partial [Bryobacteraceae bacterium]
MSEFAAAFPNSRKIFVDGPQGVHVPMREIALAGGEAPLRVYDTSGPQDHDVQRGLPMLREPWVRARLSDDARLTSPDGRLKPDAPLARARGRSVTQLHYARKGE